MTDQSDFSFVFNPHHRYSDEPVLDIWPSGVDEDLNQRNAVFDFWTGSYITTSSTTTQPTTTTAYSQAPPIGSVVGTIDYPYVPNPNPEPSISGIPGVDTTRAPDANRPRAQRPKRHGGCRGTHQPGSIYFIKNGKGCELPLPELGAAPSIDEFTQWFTAFGKARRQCRSGGKLPTIACPLQDCGIHFTKSSELKAHLSFYFNIRAYKCDECSMDSCTKGNLGRHKKKHYQK